MIEEISLGKYLLYNSVITLNIGTNYTNKMRTGTLTKIRIHLINVP